MSRNARKLVKKLSEIDVIIHGASFHILRDIETEHLNRKAGEAAPTWQLLVEPLRDTRTDRIVANGRKPTVRFPNGCMLTLKVYGYQPLTHILRTPLEQWDVDVDEYKRLLVSTFVMPKSWK